MSVSIKALMLYLGGTRASICKILYNRIKKSGTPMENGLAPALKPGHSKQFAD